MLTQILLLSNDFDIMWVFQEHIYCVFEPKLSSMILFYCVYYALAQSVGCEGFQAVATTVQLQALLFLDKSHSYSPLQSAST